MNTNDDIQQSSSTYSQHSNGDNFDNLNEKYQQPSESASDDVEKLKKEYVGQEDSEKIKSNEKQRYTLRDLTTAKAPNFQQKVQTLLYNKGLGSMPLYMKEIYLKIPRTIYVNQDIPDSMKDKTGHPAFSYAKNKIRTTKYTPLTFIPKNLAFQFRNAANAYFLILVILGAFQIFGVSSPGLAAVPLIVIVAITALRDAFEDYRRGSSDSALNNSPIHLIQGLDNKNVMKDYVSNWRKFKKFSTRTTNKVAGGMKKAAIMMFGKKKVKQDFIRNQVETENALRRTSTVISEEEMASYRPSFQSNRRKSHQSQRTRPENIANSIVNTEIVHSNPDTSGVTFRNKRWKDVCVGDFIRVRSNEEVPADMIIISTSDAEGNCFIETKNLDGETNLKMKKALTCGGVQHIRRAHDLANSKFWIECDSPNPHLYSFKGTIHYENYDESGALVNKDEKESITNDSVLLRGSTLRNTKWVIGVVAYTGRETKIMLNSGITPTKASRISRELNLSVFINFALLFILCLVSAVINGIYYDKPDTSRVFYEFEAYGSTPAINAVICFFVVLIIYQSLVPISLYVSVEIIKTCQAFFIFSDIKMYYDKLDFPCTPKSWNISDDLGQIEYVFSDKTGTLTQNVMEFKKCTINGVSYGLAYTEAKQGLDKRNGVDVIKQQELWRTKIQQDKESMMNDIYQYANNDQFRESNLTFVSGAYTKDTLNPDIKDAVQKEANEEFMLALALCHTVMTEANNLDEKLRDFKAESPDEAALVSVARDVGITFKERQRNRIFLDFYGEERVYELLETIQFTSARKRMSSIIKTPEGKVVLYCKGADNIIFQKLSKSDNSQNAISKTALHLEDYAKEGLRTLCITSKELDPYYFDQWLKKYMDAKASIDDSREQIMNTLEDEIEDDLVLLGGTAIEDRLQSGVPDSISILSQAGIKLWVLTGDRIETAINIGFSCNLLNNDMKLLVVRPDESNPDDFEYLDNLISNYLSENFEVDNLSNANVDELIKLAIKDHSTPTSNLGLVIDGAALTHVFHQELDGSIDEKHQYLRKKFLLLGKQCKSVICCRVSPSQKAQVTKLVKEQLKVMTLAIGDGANDVAMIQAADVGVGIAGEEGRQAVMSSDYGIGQFRFLTRLLLVHGRWSYKRLAEMVPCFFYKNVLFTFTCFWYGIYNDFDGSYFYEYTFLMFYNLAFTSLPIIFLAVFDQDVSDTVSLIVPQLYRSGILRQEWSQIKFSWYMIDGFYQSVVAFFFVYLTYYLSFQNPQGLAVDHRFWQGTVCVMISVTAADVYVLLQQYRWDWLSLIIYALSILIVFFWTGVWSARVYAGEFYGAGSQVLGTLSLWCTYFIGTVVCLLPRFFYDFLRKNFKPRDIDIIREKFIKGDYDEYPHGYDPTNAEDVEKYRLLKELYQADPEAIAKFEQEFINDSDSSSSSERNDPFTKTFKSIRRRTTISRSRKNTINNDISNTFQKPIDLNKLRLQMLKNGELSSNGNTNLSRISTTHELPGLTQAETLLSYHTRTSINFDH
ncbi:phospholipid-transporting ATPase Dnf1p [[Candida] jaroonii]|uniref:Phospholipid-transporting ATPase Dnf1p n=1 Tax=[Candida] jaroonii TaxID=467808 RepID=A0ACA9YEZ9_9ASCO|nr:phospholipid-transporting ATPase Dnf1p [[Candida] jaroonii]